jgi:hypothetical protein
MFSSLLSYSLMAMDNWTKGAFIAPQGIVGNGYASRVWKEDMACISDFTAKGTYSE